MPASALPERGRRPRPSWTTPLRSPFRAWRRSLPFRVIVTTFVGAVVVMVLGGILLVHQASEGILEAKRQASVQTASTALQRMQDQLRQTDTSVSIDERLDQLASEAGTQAGQFRLVVQGPVSGYVSSSVDTATLPPALVAQVTKGSGMYLAPTRLRWTDPSRAPEPALVVGATLYPPDLDTSFPVYFIFPEDKEVQTIHVVQQAALSTGVLLLMLLTGLSWLVSHQVVEPVREASESAQRLASGHLDERMEVRGTTDLANLATSMNDMAAEIQRQIGQLEELSRVQQRFVSDVSHELRTPLTTVRMAADLIYEERDELDPVAARSAELMHDELERFESLLADLLEISRFDAGAAVLTLDTTDLADVVRAEVEAQAPFAERMGTPLRMRAEGDTTADMDARRVRRIVRNLLTNAIEHGERRPVDVWVRGEGDAVAVTVRDHGVGFEPSQNQQVFMRFWRADPSRQRTVGGTGLGLAISLEDARLHHGWLSAWGRPGQGAQFRLTLPREHGVILSRSPLPLAPTDLLPRVERAPLELGRGSE